MFRVDEQQFWICKIFCDAKPQTVADLCGAAQAVSYPRNHQIYVQEDCSTDFHLVVSGTVRAKGYSLEGKEVSYGDIGPGELFGEFAALDNDTRSAGIIAVDDVQALKMPSNALCSAVETDGKVALKLLLSLVEKSRKQTGRIYEFSVFAVRQRIQQELLRLANFDPVEQNAELIGSGVTLDIPTHQELANRLSTHREAVTRELRFLTKQGLIATGKDGLHIPDIRRLAQFAGNLNVSE